MMLIVATFKQTLYVDLALTRLEQDGIGKRDILVAPLKQTEQLRVASDFPKVHRGGRSPFDKSFILAMIGMLLGSIYGFVLAWGPIIWALLGIVAGACLGLVIDLGIHGWPAKERGGAGEIVLMVQCEAGKSDYVQNVLAGHQALGISVIEPME